ncbi:MAG: phytanoyl-CoA dioxygenase family protein [Gemmataceae bacterium]|nr:phytanoyl-CoA dioxygenase family protein [Gemmataceae bacterium]
MEFWRQINDGRGYALEALTPDELAAVRGMITDQYLDGLREAAPGLVNRAEAVGLDQYHTLPIPFDHGSFWEKRRRVLPASAIPAFERMGFFRRIRDRLPSASVYHDDLMWRIVRPGQPSDIGPVHADKWFWDAGNGSIPAGHDRFKIWVGVWTEPGLNGLSVKSYSHTSDKWKHHFEFKHGKMKPVLDESAEALNMELLPLRSGEMVFFHDALLHGGVVNAAQTCRVSIELTVAYKAEEGERLLAAARKTAA